MVAELYDDSVEDEESGYSDYGRTSIYSRTPSTKSGGLTREQSVSKMSPQVAGVTPVSNSREHSQKLSPSPRASRHESPQVSSRAPVIQRRVASVSGRDSDEETDSDGAHDMYHHRNTSHLSLDETVSYRQTSRERQRSPTKVRRQQLQQQELLRQRQRQQQQLQQQRLLQENQHRETELLAKQKRLEERQLQQKLEQRLQRQKLLQLQEDDQENCLVEPFVVRRPLGSSNSAKSLTISATSTPKKKKPSNPMQRAPTTENILATVRAPLVNRRLSSNMMTNSIPPLPPSISVSKNSSGLLGNKRVLSHMEDKENRPMVVRKQSSKQGGGDDCSQSPPRSPLSSTALYKRQKPTASPSRGTLSPPVTNVCRTPSPVLVSKTPPPAPVKRSNTLEASLSLDLAVQSILAPTLAPVAPPVDFATALISTMSEPGVQATEMLSPASSSQKEFLNCFDQWMSDLGTEDLDPFSQSQLNYGGAAPALTTATTSVAIPDPFAAFGGAGQDVLSGQEDVPEFDDSEIDQLLYSEVGEDYGIYSGHEGVDTPGSELGSCLDLGSESRTPGTDMYEWFSEGGGGGGVGGDETSGTVTLPYSTLMDQHHLSLLSTDPVLASSPAELSQGLELGIEFDPTGDPLWLQQELQLQHRLEDHSTQDHYHSQTEDVGPSSSRAGTPSLDSSASSNLLSSALSEMLSSSPIAKRTSSAHHHHYVPMGPAGQPLDLSMFDLGGDLVAGKDTLTALSANRDFSQV